MENNRVKTLYFYSKGNGISKYISLQSTQPLFIGSQPLHEKPTYHINSTSGRGHTAKDSGTSATITPLSSGTVPLASGIMVELAANIFY